MTRHFGTSPYSRLSRIRAGAPGTTQGEAASVQAGSSVSGLKGSVVYLYAFDVAYDMKRRQLQTLLGQPVAQFAVDASKRSPRQLFFFRPQMVRMPALEKLGPGGSIRLERIVKLLPVGAISIMIRIPFEVDRLEDLVQYHELRFSDGRTVDDEVRDLAEQVRRELKSDFIRPHDMLGDEEAYTVFCINGPLKDDKGATVSAENWMLTSRRQIAALLTQESDSEFLSDQEADESSAKYFSYYETDVVVMDWDAAVVVDEPRFFDEVLYIMELANLQLAELEAYDRILDEAVERAYRDLAHSKSWRGLTLTNTQRDLREIRIDLARLSDELGNTTKFFGDWHLARIYHGLASRFHLGEWHHAIDEKLKTLDDLYRLMQTDRTNRWMLILELTIVVLFLVEIIKSIVGH